MFVKSSENSSRRGSQNVGSSVVVNRSSQLPPLLEHKSNLSKLTSSAPKMKTRMRENICRHDSRSEINRFLLTQAEQQLILEHPMSYNIDRLLSSVLQRGKKINELLTSAKLNTDTGFMECLKASRCIRLSLYNTYEKMYRKGRIGCDLKGINRQILQQIEQSLIEAVAKQIKLYQNKLEFSSQRQTLINQLDSYKRELSTQLQYARML